MIKSTLNTLLSGFGFEVRRKTEPFYDPLRSLNYVFSDKENKETSSNNVKILFDVGANIGQSVSRFRRWYPNSIIHCFEPDTETFKLLRKNTQHLKGVVLNSFGLGEKSFQSDFYRNDNSTVPGVTNSIYKTVECGPGINEKTSVKIKTLDEYVKDNEISHIDLVKIDVQGYEPMVLEGGTQFLKSGKVKTLLIEVILNKTYEKQVSFLDLERTLVECGFSLYDISSIKKNSATGRTIQLDALYVHQNYQ